MLRSHQTLETRGVHFKVLPHAWLTFAATAVKIQRAEVREPLAPARYYEIANLAEPGLLTRGHGLSP